MWKVIAISIEIVGVRTLLAMAAMSAVHNAKRASASSRIVYSVSGLEELGISGLPSALYEL